MYTLTVVHCTVGSITHSMRTQVLLEHIDQCGERLLLHDTQARVLVAARRDRLELRVQVEVQIPQHLRLHREARERRQALEERRQIIYSTQIQNI